MFPHFRNSNPSPTVRLQRIIQATLFENFAEHEIGRELRAMSQCLDRHRELLGLVMNDLRCCEVRATGRDGLSAETVVRCALLKQYRQLSYEELAFHLEDSASFIAFARAAAGLVAERSSRPVARTGQPCRSFITNPNNSRC